MSLTAKFSDSLEEGSTSGTFTIPAWKVIPPEMQPKVTAGGRVGVCLSGGGSRAMAAGIGQLQGLSTLAASDNIPLLNKVSMLVTVSGGGWVGIPFTYLPDSVSDQDFLGTYVDRSRLAGPDITATPELWIGTQITQDFSLEKLATAAVVLRFRGVPTNMLWQTLMGIHFLCPYDLFTNVNYSPNSLFAADLGQVQRYVTGPNPALQTEAADVITVGRTVERPFLSSVMGMFVSVPVPDTDDSQLLLVPVESTPWYTGLVSTPANALDQKGNQVGGGVVASFGFNSNFQSIVLSTATATQGRQWALTDVLGTSSAAFAAKLKEIHLRLFRSPERLTAALTQHKESVLNMLGKCEQEMLDRGSVDALIASVANDGFEQLKADLVGGDPLAAIDPAYFYWTPATPPSESQTATQTFADGGSLDNSGIATMLAYGMNTIIAFVNSSFAFDAAGPTIDPMIWPLFGKKSPHDLGVKQDVLGVDLTQKNQVFNTTDFDALVAGLAASIGENEARPAIFLQQLTTLENAWFNVRGGQTINVLWVYLSMSTDWSEGITNEDVRNALQRELNSKFPNYETDNTELTPQGVHLLSNLTSWTIQAPENQETFLKAFDS